MFEAGRGVIISYRSDLVLWCGTGMELVMVDDGTQRGFGKYLGFTVVRISDDSLCGTVSISPEHYQRTGIVHGGVYCAVVEHAASVAAGNWSRGRVVGVSNSTNFIRAVRSGQLQVEATPLQRGRTQQLWQVFIRDELGRLIAKGEVRFANIDNADNLGRSGAAAVGG
ncbi:MAG TPA: PaaI family thioesterase [Pseudonocardia sp.]|nr:PaaI family thioesterase [Pseudonocardia sp.]